MLRKCFVTVLRSVGVILFALAFSFGPKAAVADETVRIGVGVDPVYTPWWIAERQGFFKKYGIKAEITQFPGGPDLADATMAGELDVGSTSTTSWMPRITRGSLFILAEMATSSDALKLAALTSVSSLQDLVGKKVGTVSGSATDYLWSLLARKLNVPDTAFKTVSVPPPELIPALDRRDIEAFFIWEPWASRAVAVSGKDKVRILANSGDVGYALYFVVVANQKFLAAKPAAAVGMLAALRDAIEYQNSHPEEAAKIGGEANKLKPEAARNVINLYKFGFAISPGLESTAKTEEAWMRSKGRVKGEPIDWSKTIDRSYFDKAMARK